jgi:hypothetical protein
VIAKLERGIIASFSFNPRERGPADTIGLQRLSKNSGDLPPEKNKKTIGIRKNPIYLDTESPYNRVKNWR